MSIALVGQTSFATVGGSSTTITGTYTATPGNLLVLEIQHISALVSSVTDTGGNTWVSGPDTQAANTATSSKRIHVWYCLGAATPGTITVTFASTTFANAALQEFSGAVSYRGGNSGISSSTSPPAITVTGTKAGDLVLGVIGYTEVTAGTRQDVLNTSGTPAYIELAGASLTTTQLSAAYSIRTADGLSGPAWTLSSGTTGSVTVAFSGTAITTPTAIISNAVVNGQTVLVSGSGSVAVNPATISSYAWSYGDSVTATGVSPTQHRYTAAGTYTINLTVTDSNGGTSTASTVVTAVAGSTNAFLAAITNGTGWSTTAASNLAAISDTDPTTFITSTSNPTGLPLEGYFTPLIAPTTGNAFVVSLLIDRISSSSGTISASIYDYDGTTVRSTVTGVAIQDVTASGGSGTATTGTVVGAVTFVFPASDVVNVTSSGWDKLTIKMQATAS